MTRRRTLFLFVFVILLFTAQLGQDRNVASTYSTKGFGTKAFLLLLQEMGIEAKPWLYPFSELDKSSTNNVLFIISPKAKLGSSKKLMDWVEAGNTLIMMHSFGKFEAAYKDLKLNEENVEQNWLERIAAKSKKSMSITCEGLPNEICQNVSKLSMSSNGYTSKELKRDFSDGAIFHSNGVKVLAVRHKRGEGEHWLFFDDIFLQNDYIDQFDNLALFYQLASRGERVYFDEFHHGFKAPVSSERKAREDAVIVLTGFLVLVLIIAALSRSIRFGPPLPTPLEDQSSSIEFAVACGLLYQEHNLVSTLRYYLESWKVRLSKKYGFSKRVEQEKLPAELLRRGVISKGQAKELAVNLIAIKNNNFNSQIINELEELVEQNNG